MSDFDGMTLDDVLNGGPRGSKPKGIAADDSSDVRGMTLDDVLYQKAPVRPQVNEPGLWSDTKRTVGGRLEGAGHSLEDVGYSRVARRLQEGGKSLTDANPAEINTIQDIVDKPGTAVREAIGELPAQIAQNAGLATLGGAIGGVVGAAGLGVGAIPAAAFGAMALPFAANLLQSYGGIRKEQKEEGTENIPLALGAGVVSAGLDTAFGGGKWARDLARKGLSPLARDSGTNLLKHTAVQGGKGILEEGGTEFLQTGIERFGAGKDLTSKDAIDEYGVAIFKGGVGGGAMKGGMSSIAGKLPDPNAPVQPPLDPADPALAQAINTNDPTAQANYIASLPPQQQAEAHQQAAVAGIGPQSLTPDQASNFATSMDRGPQPEAIAQSGQVAAANAANNKSVADANAAQNQSLGNEAFAIVASAFGVIPSTDPKNPNGYTIGNKPLFTRGDAVAFIKGLDAATSQVPEAMKPIIGAVVMSGAVEVAPGANPKGVVSSVLKFMAANQLDTATSVPDVIGRINAQIAAIPAKDDVRGDNKNAKFAHSLNQLHKQLTGQESPALADAAARNDAHQAAELAAKAAVQEAKDKLKAADKAAKAAAKPQKAVATPKAPKATKAAKPEVATKVDPNAPSAVTTGTSDAVKEAQARLDAEEAKLAALTTGATDGQQQQTPAGVGAVSNQNSAAGSNDGLLGLDGSTDVQPLESGSEPAGSDVVENDTGRDGGDGQPALLSTAVSLAPNANDQTPQVSTPVTAITGRVIGKRGRAPRPGETNGRSATTIDAATGEIDTGSTGTSGTPRTELSFGPDGNVVIGPRVSGQSDTGGEAPKLLGANGDVSGSNITESGKSEKNTGSELQTVGGQTLAEQHQASTEKWLGSYFLRVFTAANPGAQDLDAKAAFFVMYGKIRTSQRVKTNAEIATDLGVSESQVKKWSAEVGLDNDTPKFFVKYAVQIKDLAKVVEAELAKVGMVPNDLFTFLNAGSSVNQLMEQNDRADEKSDAQQFLEEGSGFRGNPEDVVTGDRTNDAEGDSDSSITVRTGSMGESKNDRANSKNEGATAKYEKLELAREEAEQSGDQDAIDAAQKALDELGTEQATRNRRASGIKGAKDADAAKVNAAAATQTRTPEQIAAETADLVPRAIANWGKDAESAGVPSYESLNANQKYQVAKLEREGLTGTAREARMKGIAAQNTKPVAAAKTPAKTTAPKKTASTKVTAEKVAKTEKVTPAAPAAPVVQSAANAGEAWDAVAKDLPGAPTWDRLSDEDRKTFTEYGPENWTRKDVVSEIQKLDDEDLQYSEQDAPVTEALSEKELRDELNEFMGTDTSEKIQIITDEADLPEDVRNHKNYKPGFQALVADGVVYMNAPQIEKGKGRAVLMHELGVHLGLQKLLSSLDHAALVAQIKSWANLKNDSVESRVAQAAMGRVLASSIPRAVKKSATPEAQSRFAAQTQQGRNNELLAYFVEEAILEGINPAATTATNSVFEKFVRRIYAAFKSAIRKLHLGSDNLTAQDVVNLAYGAARISLAGRFHGTGAEFKKFDHEFMNTGEGAQAFGWGSYFAQKRSIADRTYRKTESEKNHIKVVTQFLKTHAGATIVSGNLNTLKLSGIVGRPVNYEQLAEGLINSGETEIVLRKNSVEQLVKIPAAPYGSLHLTDFAIADNEWMDLERSMKDQSPKVQTVWKDFRDELGENDYEELAERIAEDQDDPTGKEFYAMLKEASKQDMMLSDDPQVLKAQQLGQDDRAASMYLDEKGVKGLKFLDQPSRSDNFTRKAIARRTRAVAEAEDQLQKAQEDLEKHLAEQPSEYTKTNPEFLVQWQSRQDKWVQRNRDWVTHYEANLAQRKQKLAEYLERHPDLKPATRNSVVFNDKNILRISTKKSEEKDSDLQYSFASKAAAARTIAKNIATLPTASQPYYKAMSGLISRSMDAFKFTGALIARAEKSIGKSATDYFRAMRERVAIRNNERRAIEKIGKAFEQLPQPEQDAANAHLKASTRAGTWGFAPAWLTNVSTGQAIKPDAAMKVQFDKLTPAAQNVVRDVFAHGYANLKNMQRLIKATIGPDYDIGIANALARGEIKEAARIRQDKDHALKTLTGPLDLRGDKPYAPLGRHGDHVVIMRSPVMVAAQKVLNERATGNHTDAAIKAAQKTINRLQDDPTYYQVHFAENGVQAAKIEADLKKSGNQVQSFMKDRVAEEMFGTTQMQGLLHRTRNLANKQADDELSASHRAINNLLTKLHLELMSENSARHSENRRYNIEGADDNMMRSFYQHGVSNAGFLAGLHKSKQIEDSLEAMKRSAGDVTQSSNERAERSQLYNEIAKRHGMGMDAQENAAVNTILKTTSAYMLLTKPLYYVQNAMQPLVVSLPYLAGKHQGRAVVAMTKAYADASAVMAKNTLTLDVIAKLPTDVRQAVRELVMSGDLNIDLDQDMGDRLKGTNVLTRTVAKLQNIAERVEGVNRVTTAMAAYRLEIAKGVSHEAAVKYAAGAVYKTHFDYSGLNAPRVMRSDTGRVLTQFKKFQFGQIALIADLAQQSWSGATKEEKSAARYALGYTLGTTFTFGGLMALPGYQAIAWVLGHLFPEGDEPDDPEAQEARMRRAIGDPMLADFLIKGVPKALGMDMQAVFGGFGGMLSVLPFTKIEDFKRSTGEDILIGLAGPTAGLALKVYEGAGKLAEGDYMGALQKVTPTGIANVVKAIDQNNKGLTRASGSTIMAPDEISAFDSAMTAIGLKTNAVADKEFINRVETTYEHYYSSQTAKVEHAYVAAFKDGNSEGMQKARERWMELNNSKRELGFKTQPMSDLFKAPQAARKLDQRNNKNMQRSGATAAGYN